MELWARARHLLDEFGKGHYRYGAGALEGVGAAARELGERALVVGNRAHLEGVFAQMEGELAAHGVEIAGGEPIPGAGANTPVSDVARIRDAVLTHAPDFVIAVGGGSTIDAVKAAAAWSALGGELTDYFGTNQVTKALERSNKRILPLLAVQTAAGSGAHLTKYANVTFVEAGQKKLMVDEALVPRRAVFDYDVTMTVPLDVSLDGALDSMSHLVEVFFGIGEGGRERAGELVEVGLPLILRAAPRLLEGLSDSQTRTELGLAADLGAYAIMIGGTNGPHLNSFSLVDLASHGRACAILGPYYAAFFAPAIGPQLRLVARIFEEAGYLSSDAQGLTGRDLGLAVAHGMLSFLESLGYPTSLQELPGFDYRFVEQALAAAADLQLAMKLQNMPIPFTSADIDRYMRPLLDAAVIGDLAKVPF